MATLPHRLRFTLLILLGVFLVGNALADDRRQNDDSRRTENRNDDTKRPDRRNDDQRQNRPNRNDDAGPRQDVRHTSKPVVRPDERPGNYRSPYWVLDGRYRHNHYYPVPGYTVTVLPSGYQSVWYSGNRYYYHAGVWFRPQGARFIVAAPPVGVVVPLLPPDYSTVWIDGRPYYYANGQYYVPASESGFTVVAPPAEASVESNNVIEARPTVPDLVVYPRNNQSQSQVFADRAECARQAADQTGIDPLANAGDDERSQAALNQYRRAEAACLQQRNYTVR